MSKDVGLSQLRLLREDASSAPAGGELMEETGGGRQGLCGHTADLALLAPALGFLRHSPREKQSMPH